MEILLVACLIILFLAIYFVPYLIGRNKTHSTGILILNLFLGWTVLGWFGVLNSTEN